MSSRPTFENFKKKALANNDVRKEYEALAAAYELAIEEHVQAKGYRSEINFVLPDTSGD